MRKYAQIQDLVLRLTDDRIFRTFFTVYLMAESDQERQILNNRFWQDASTLNENEQQILRAELTRCFLKLPSLCAHLLNAALPAELA